MNVCKYKMDIIIMVTILAYIRVVSKETSVFKNKRAHCSDVCVSATISVFMCVRVCVYFMNVCMCVLCIIHAYKPPVIEAHIRVGKRAITVTLLLSNNERCER